jgi:tetratricopeptide (TPR) repeat protein
MPEAKEMKTITDILSRKLVAGWRARPVPLPILALFISLFLMPLAGYAAQDSPAVKELQQKAQHAYIDGRYAEAAALDLEIAQKHPVSDAHRYAVQMLGTIYENNLVDVQKAIKWDREYLEKYADPRQVPYYQEKLASLERLMSQEEAFKTYQAILFTNLGDEIIVKKFEALLKEHPDFILKDKVLSELGSAYDRLDNDRQSYLAFRALSENGKKKLSTSDQIAYETASRHWKETSAWGWIAWGVVVALWGAVLLMKPWKRLTWTSIRKFLIWPVLWVLLTAVRMPTFYSIETGGYPIVIPDTVVYMLAGLNLTVLFWLLLLIRGEFWQTRPRALRWLSPVLMLLMTTAVLYLFFIYQPAGPEIIDVFADTLHYKLGIM